MLLSNPILKINGINKSTGFKCIQTSGYLLGNLHTYAYYHLYYYPSFCECVNIIKTKLTFKRKNKTFKTACKQQIAQQKQQIHV